MDADNIVRIVYIYPDSMDKEGKYHTIVLEDEEYLQKFLTSKEIKNILKYDHYYEPMYLCDIYYEYYNLHKIINSKTSLSKDKLK